MIKIKDLYLKEIKCMVDVTILNGITYLKGRNGSGKTIFLDYLCSIRKDKNNKIIGNDNIVYLRQNFAFYSRISTKEFIKFIYEINEMDFNSFFDFIEQRGLEFNYSKIKNTKLGLLSGGERRSLYLYVILSLDKNIYVLDEPFVNLDKETKSTIINLIYELKNEGKNFIITTHEETDYFDELKTSTIDFEKVKYKF